MFRRLALGAVITAVTATVAPAATAAPAVKNAYFANTGSCGQEDPVYSLVPTQQDGGECSGTLTAYQGNGFVPSDVYTSIKSQTYRVDTTRKVTGTVYIQHFGIITLVPKLPGYATANVTVKLDSTKLGTKNCSGQIAPLGALKCDLSFSIPASFKGKVAKKLTATVDWVDSVGLSGVSYTQPYASMLVVPVR